MESGGGGGSSGVIVRLGGQTPARVYSRLATTPGCDRGAYTGGHRPGRGCGAFDLLSAAGLPA